MTRSIFDKTPLPYVPETTSEFELKRDIIKYNLRTYVTPRALLAILLGEKGSGWYHLPPRWYFKPRELYHVARIGVTVALNMAVAFLPLWVTEPVMNALSPAMKRRPRVRNYAPDTFHASSWDKDTAKQKTVTLKAAIEERRATGRVNIELSTLAGPGYSTDGAIPALAVTEEAPR